MKDVSIKFRERNVGKKGFFFLVTSNESNVTICANFFSDGNKIVINQYDVPNSVGDTLKDLDLLNLTFDEKLLEAYKILVNKCLEKPKKYPKFFLNKMVEMYD
ncbi:MAG: hypothetical protein ACRCZ9_05575 [Fusobacteriaceae bacterium]